MKNQTLSIEQMKHLKDLGVDVSKASMCWAKWVNTYYTLDASFSLETSESARLGESPDEGSSWECVELTPAFTLQDMLEIMPVCICEDKYFLQITFDELTDTNTRVYTIRYVSVSQKDFCYFEGSSLIKVSFEMLCWLTRNGHLKGGKE